MTDDTNIIIRTMRSQAWERAKGELEAMLATFWGSAATGNQFSDLYDSVKGFIKKVEDESLHE